MTFYCKIGTDRQGNNVYYVTYGRYGVTIIEASTRVGKTQIARNITTYEAAILHRPTLIFDYEGEWRYTKFANTDCKGYAYGISHLEAYTNIVFKIEDFDQSSDWESLGFPQGAARILSEMARMTICETCAKNKGISGQPLANVYLYGEVCPVCQHRIHNPERVHHNDFAFFEKMIRWYPNEYSKDWSYTRFHSIYGWRPIAGINSKSQEAISARLQTFDYIFWKDESDVEQTYIENWAEELLRKRCICINFGMKTEDKRQVLRSRAIAGKVLFQLSQFAKGQKSTYLEILHPLLVFEEADRIFPFMMNEELKPTSVVKLEEFITKKQKYGVEIIMITQNVNMLHQTAMQNHHTIITGVGGSAIPDSGKYLRWDVDEGIREFLLVRKGKWEQKIFTPSIVPCMLAPAR